MLVVWQLGWVEIDLGCYTTYWAAGVMAEWAEQVGRLVELENLSQPNQLPDHQHYPVHTTHNPARNTHQRFRAGSSTALWFGPKIGTKVMIADIVLYCISLILSHKLPVM